MTDIDHQSHTLCQTSSFSDTLGESFSRFEAAPVNGSLEILDFLQRKEEFISEESKVLKKYETRDKR